jgi:S1-C subfamily serine protease
MSFDNFENYIVKLNVKSVDYDFNHPLNLFSNSESSGTGFFITNSLILTCYHVVKASVNITVLYKQTEEFNGIVKHIFPHDDLAIIEVPPVSDAKIFKFKIINTKHQGDVFTVGFPLNSSTIKITKGIISGYQDSLIQTDAALNPGNSGGPMIIYENNEYCVIGVNVSKMLGGAERTGFIVPIYRFSIIYPDYLTDKVINKPLLYFKFQKLKQKRLLKEIYGNEKINSGIRITIINRNYYIYKHLKENEILLGINGNIIDTNGYIKLPFFPEKISIKNVGLWFKVGDVLSVLIFNPITKQTRTEKIKLQIIDNKLIQYHFIKESQPYYIENNGLILSIFSNEHMNYVKELNIAPTLLMKVFERKFFQNDDLIVYLSDVNYNLIKNKQIEYPVGNIITEINNKTFKNIDEFYNIFQNNVKIIKIKTIDNDIFYV